MSVTPQELAEQRDIWLRELGLTPRTKISLSTLLKRIEKKAGKPIKVVTLPILPRIGSGVSTLDGDIYYIGIEESLVSPLRETVILHEATHIFFGDVEIQRVCYRSNDPAYEAHEPNYKVEVDETNEKIVEYVAECLAEKLLSPEIIMGDTIFQI